MEIYKGDYLSELDQSELEIKEILDDFTKEWSTDEMIGLLVECEFALSYNKGRIEQLEAKRFKRLYYILTGIERANKKLVLKGTHQIQNILFKIQKILLKRINLVSLALCSLEGRVDQEILWTQDVINSLLDKLENVPKKTDLLWLVNTIRNMETKSGKKYIETSDGVKILLVVSELFKIVHDQTGLFDKPFLETILKDKMKLNKNINVWKFYGDVIYDKECVSLYVKDGYDYPAGKISQYGQMIYKINGFYSSPYMIDMAKSTKQSLEDMCIETYGEQIQKEDKEISTFDLCLLLLKDLADLDSEYQRRIEEQKRPEKTCGASPAMSGKNNGIGILGNPNTNRVENNTKAGCSVLRISPEGLRLFKNGDVRDYEVGWRAKDYSFSDENEIRVALEGFKPDMVTASTGYYKNCMPEIKSILSSSTKCISLADYYMYLWFRHTDQSVRRNKKIAFIEYYAHRLWVSGYDVDASGIGYENRFSGLEIKYNRTRKHIIEDIIAKWDVPSLKSYNNDITIFRTFNINKWIAVKLDDVSVKIVDNKWEDILKVNDESLGKSVTDMLNVSRSTVLSSKGIYTQVII